MTVVFITSITHSAYVIFWHHVHMKIRSMYIGLWDQEEKEDRLEGGQNGRDGER